MNKTNISFTVEPEVADIATKLQQFGNVDINSKPCELMVVTSKNKQAQIMSLNVQCRTIENITIKLQQEINTGGKNVRGCKLLPTRNLAFSTYENDQVIFIKSDGSTDSKFELKYTPFDIVYIVEDRLIAVTSGGGCNMYINIIDIGNKEIKQMIPMTTSVYGIVAINNNLFFCCHSEGLQMMNLKDRCTKTIVNQKMAMFAYIATFGEKLYYTNTDTNTVTCCNLEGTVQWEFKNESCLKGPLGISIDNAGIVYVVGGISTKVIVLSSDGQRHREISSKDGLLQPQVIYYEQTTNQLLVANANGTAFLFQVTG